MSSSVCRSQTSEFRLNDTPNVIGCNVENVREHVLKQRTKVLLGLQRCWKITPIECFTTGWHEVSVVRPHAVSTLLQIARSERFTTDRTKWAIYYRSHGEITLYCRSHDKIALYNRSHEKRVTTDHSKRSHEGSAVLQSSKDTNKAFWVGYM